MPDLPPTFNEIALENANKRYKEEPGIVSVNRCFPSRIIKVYNRSKYHIKIRNRTRSQTFIHNISHVWI